MKIVGLFSVLFFSGFYSGAQQRQVSDAPRQKTLDSVTIVSYLRKGIAERLPDVIGTNLFDGKKTCSINPGQGRMNLADNLGRMVFAQIPGLSIWDMDGAGTQMNIGSRGTDAHRSIEMNMRQNGYNTNSDIFGYPEDHYTPPMQAIGEIQLVRGSAALQFGSQFGGMMNYVMKEGDSSRPFVLESEQTVGSNNFFNSYNAAGGTYKNTRYYVYYDNRQGTGWRPNAAFRYHAYYSNFEVKLSERANLSIQFSRMDYVQQIAGGLTDAMFQHNDRQSNRSRNYFNPEINIPALIYRRRIGANTRLEITSNAIFGQRNSVQFIQTPDVVDTVNSALGSYNPRQVDRDYYSGFTTEARLLHQYRLGRQDALLAAGLRFFDETTKRSQKGVGTAGSDFDLSLTAPYGIDLRFHTRNYAFYAENSFQIGKRLSVTPGFRYEIIDSRLTGLINNASFPVSYTGKRNFPLLGLGIQYQADATSQFYGNISQAYRPYLYANITPADQIGKIDPALKDTRGYDIDLGYRGSRGNYLHFDINLYRVFYGNRIGKLTLTDATGDFYLLTTNTGDAVAQGAEAYVEFSPWNLLTGGGSQSFDLRLFESLAYDHARYVRGSYTKGDQNISLAGNSLEGVPDWISRAGIILQWKNLQSTWQYSYVSRSYSDAANTEFNPTGATGIVPSYHLWDWAFSWKLNRKYRVSAGMNNLANRKYFTRRINMYPGPGILPADGRTFYFSFGINM